MATAATTAATPAAASAATAATAEAAATPGRKVSAKKKLIIIVAAVLALVLAGGGAAFFIIKKRAAAAELDAATDDAGGATAATHAQNVDKHAALPVFLPLDPFTVNLADRDAERYAQVGITFEIDDAHSADQLKAYMPAIRNNILMLLSHKTAGELAERDGKLLLAREIRRESLRPMGYELPAEAAVGSEHSAPSNTAAVKKKKAPEPVYPIKAVQFSNFIIQ